jgi:CDP-glycerol glycerophosphotransferase
MAFSFARANIDKLLRLPLFALGIGMSRLVPKDRKLWVFGRKGMFGDNSRYLMDFVRDRCPDIRCVWLAHDDAALAAARGYGVEAVRARSFRGWWRTARARIGVVSIGLGDLNRSAIGGLRIIQLWHGSPLKKLGLDSDIALSAGSGLFARVASRLIGGLHRRAYGLPRIVTASSALVQERFGTAFALPPERIVVTGYARNDMILGGGRYREERAAWHKKLREVHGLPDDARIVLHAPTWREAPGQPLYPDADVVAWLGPVLEAQSAYMLVRSHQYDDGLAIQSGSRVMKMRNDLFPDVNCVLADFDLLISDYSGIILDFAMLGRPVLFYAPDVERYDRSRGLYEPYATFAGGGWARDWHEVTAQLDALLSGKTTTALAQAEALNRRYTTHLDTSNCERIFGAICDRIGPND